MSASSRREFLNAFCGATLLGAAGVSGAARYFGERAELPPLRELPVARTGNAVRARIVADQIQTGVATNQLGYCGSYPGPILRVREGEEFEIEYQNETLDNSNLHFHGLHVDPTGNGDNPWIEVPSRDRVTYRFLVGDGNTGLHWYHPHVHSHIGTSSLAQRRGLVGPILVQTDEDEVIPAADDRVVVLQDFEVVDGKIPRAGTNEWAVGFEGSLLLLNGAEYPKLTARHAWVRLRLLNASNARYWYLSCSDGTPFFVVALDGPFLERPRRTSKLLLPPSCRAEVMLPCWDRAPFDIVNHFYSRVGSVYSTATPVLRVIPARTSSAPQPLPDRLASWEPFPTGEDIRRRDIPIAMMTICGQTYSEGAETFSVGCGEREIWKLKNWDLMDHPLHLHTWHFEPLRLNGNKITERMRRDTVNLRPGDEMEVGINFNEFRGRGLFHCHIVEHADKGMMLAFDVV